MPYVGLGGDDVFSRYGNTTARGLLARMQGVPATQRTAALKTVMAKIDTTLQARTERYAAEAKRGGVPPGKALEVGLSRALSEGVLTELSQLGTRKTIGARSLLGLGIDSGYRRRSSGNYLGLGGVSSALQAFGVQQDAAEIAKGKNVAVGPFLFPANQEERYAIEYKTTADLAKLTSAQKSLIADMLKKGAGDDGPWSSINFATAKIPAGKDGGKLAFPALPKWISTLGVNPNQKLAGEMFFGGDPTNWDADITYDRIADKTVSPILTFKHPVSGNDWGLFLMTPARRIAAGGPTSIGHVDRFYLYYRWIPEAGWWHKLGRFVKHLPATLASGGAAIVNAVKTAADFVGDQTCNLVCNPNAVAAATTAGATNPVAAGAAVGVVIANKACKCGGAPGPVVQSSNTLLYILLGGGALLATIALTRE